MNVRTVQSVFPLQGFEDVWMDLLSVFLPEASQRMWAEVGQDGSHSSSQLLPPLLPHPLPALQTGKLPPGLQTSPQHPSEEAGRWKNRRGNKWAMRNWIVATCGITTPNEFSLNVTAYCQWQPVGMYLQAVLIYRTTLEKSINTFCVNEGECNRVGAVLQTSRIMLIWGVFTTWMCSLIKMYYLEDAIYLNGHVKSHKTDFLALHCLCVGASLCSLWNM